MQDFPEYTKYFCINAVFMSASCHILPYLANRDCLEPVNTIGTTFAADVSAVAFPLRSLLCAVSAEFQ